jgi:hypothetical protein
VRYRIKAFAPDRHDTKGFRCGSASQENVLRRTALRQQRDGYTRLFVATSAEDSAESRVVLGFYAINAHAIGTADLPAEAAPRAPRSNLIPAVFLARLHRLYAAMGFKPLPGQPERLFLFLRALPPLQPGG